MNEITFRPLSEFADIVMGQSPGAESCNSNDIGLPFLQGCGEFGRRNPDTSIFCSTPLRIGKAGSVLISIRAPVGSMNYADQNYCIGRGLAAFKAKQNLANTTFLRYAVEQNSVFLHRRSQGSTFAAVSSGDVQELPIPDFNFTDQNQIARIFETIDTAIEKTYALIDKYRQIKTGMMHDLFTRGVLPNGKLREQRNQAPEMYQETAIGWVPSDWAIQTIGRTLDSISDGPFGSNLKTEHYVVDPGVRVIRLQNVAEYTYNDRDKAYVSDRHARFLLRNKVVGGDVLIAGLGEERYPVGRACFYPLDLPPAINKADCFRARCNPATMKNKFFMLFLNSEMARRQIRRYEQGVTRPRINTGNMKRLSVCLPSIDEQDRIIEKFESIQSKINLQLVNVKKLNYEKFGLMQDLLTGKVEVNIENGH